MPNRGPSGYGAKGLPRPARGEPCTAGARVRQARPSGKLRAVVRPWHRWPANRGLAKISPTAAPERRRHDRRSLVDDGTNARDHPDGTMMIPARENRFTAGSER